MLNIQPVSFRNNFNYNLRKNISSTKLAPLSKDTVSFTGERQLTDIRAIVKESGADFDEIHQNASVAEGALKKTLNRALSPFVITEDNPKGIIEPISVRTKSPESIEEKVISVLAEAVKQADPSLLFKIENSQSIKEHVDDIIGARVILDKSDPKDNVAIVDALISLVRNNELKIKKIEMIVPSDKNISPYFDRDDIERLVLEVNKKRNHNNPVKFKPKTSKTGYCALHIDLDLSDRNKKAIYDGYSGEIQIMGCDVAKLKDVEDLCYKIKQDKSIAGRHPAYDTFVNHLNKYFKYENPKKSEEDNKEIAELYKAFFKEYTYKAYIIQRKKDKNSPNCDILPTLKECGMEGKLPEDLDFNYLRMLKDSCDKIYELSKRSRLEDEDVASIVKSSKIYFSELSKIQNQSFRNQFLKLLNDLYKLTAHDQN